MNNIRRLREKKHLTAKELGQAIGKSQPTICKWEKAPSLRYEHAKLIADYFKVPVYEVIGEKPEQYLEDIRQDMVSIDIINLQKGRSKILGRQLMPATVLKEYTTTAPESIKIIKIDSEAMKPTISPNDMVWVDTACKSPDSDGIYLLNIGDKPTLKRIQIKPLENSAVIKSDNPQYGSFDYDDYRRIKVLGKVIFHIQKL